MPGPSGDAIRRERGAAPFEWDTLVPTQYFDRLRRGRRLAGEERLMCAILEDAVDVYRKCAGATHGHDQTLFAEAERWIESDDRSWIYAFETVCECLGLDGDYLRRGLRSWRMRACAVTAPAAWEGAASWSE